MGSSMTLSEFNVDLQSLSDAADAIQTQATTISDQCAAINQAFGQVTASGVWTTPAGGSFAELQAACTTAMTNLDNLLTEMISRMRAAYQNYHDAELSNFKNFDNGG